MVAENCEHGNASKSVARRPRYGAELAGNFGDMLVVDIFFLWGLTFVLMIDEAVRFEVACLLASKDAKSLMKASGSVFRST